MHALIVVTLSTLCSSAFAASGEGELPEALQRPQKTAIETPNSAEGAESSLRTGEWRAIADSVAPLLRACLDAERARGVKHVPSRAEVRLKLDVDGKVISSQVHVEGQEVSPGTKTCADDLLAPLLFPSSRDPVVVAYTLDLLPLPPPTTVERSSWLASLSLGGLCGPTSTERP